MNRMRETVTTVSSSRDHESNLDALLEDLQTTVSRSNSSANLNGNVTGYRSIRRTTSDGTPEGTTTEYHVEYLNPANSTHHVVESSYHSGNSSIQGKNMAYKYNAIESSGGSSGDLKLRKNMSELDLLLDDLNSAQKREFSESSIVSRNTSGIDPGLLEPATSTPHVSRTVEKHFREEKSVRGRSSSPRRDLVFTGNRSRDPSPIQHQTYYEQREQTPTMQQFYRYEKTTSTRTTGPLITEVTDIDPGSTHNSRSYNYVEDAPLAIKQRSPSPGGQLNSSYYSNTTQDLSRSPYISGTNEKSSNFSKDIDAPEFHPSRYTGSKASSYSYTSTTRESRNDSSKPAPPHRSPSPVSFPQPPLPNVKSAKSYNYEQHSSSSRPQSPLPNQKFSPSDPSHRLTYTISNPHTTTSMYKYSSTTSTTNQYPDGYSSSMPRPFPSVPPSPPTVHYSHGPDQQNPPKKLDELMATFSDTDSRQHRYTETNVHRYRSTNGHATGPPAVPQHAEDNSVKEVNKIAEKEKIVEKGDSKNVSGPPVYYPPGELFAKKEESSMMQQQSGGGKYKAKGKYEYEAKSKSKSKESSGKAVVPVCLPVCCAMPCSIM